MPIEKQVIQELIDRLFHPASVGVVGVSSRIDNPGTMLLRALIDMGFEGALYPVNPKYKEILGLSCYPSIKELPTAPDLVILAVPPGAVPGVLSECIASKVSAVVINTAGFSETGTARGSEIEEEVRSLIAQSSIRAVGPNCLGIYSSRGKLALFAGQKPQEGRVGCVSQSGSIASLLYMTGIERALSFSKMVSSGNELDLNCTDFLEYFAEDPDTDIVVAYLEEVRDPRRFLESASSMKGKKPLIVWRAGMTDGGRRAAASHTSALAGNRQIWLAASRQVGIVNVGDLADALETLAAFYHLEKPLGRRVCVISPPGGIAVNAADAVETSGLLLPVLRDETVERLRGMLPGQGTAFANPVDMGFGAVVEGKMHDVIRVAAADENVDLIIAVGGAPASRDGDVGLMKMHTAEIKKAAASIDKPLVGVGVPSAFASTYMTELHWAGIPCYQTPAAACRALSRFVGFWGL